MYIYPVSWCEVDCFSKIVSLVETRVVGAGECDHKLASVLIRPEGQDLVYLISTFYL